MDFKLLSSQPVKAIVLCIFEAHSPPNIFSKIYNTSFLTYSQRGSKYFVCGLTKIYIYILNGTLALTLTPGGSDKCAHPLQAILMIAAIYSTIVSLLKVRYKIASNPHNHPTGKFISFLLQIKKKKKKTEAEKLGTRMGTAYVSEAHIPQLLSHPGAQELFAWSQTASFSRLVSFLLFIQTD